MVKYIEIIVDMWVSYQFTLWCNEEIKGCNTMSYLCDCSPTQRLLCQRYLSLEGIRRRVWEGYTLQLPIQVIADCIEG